MIFKTLYPLTVIGFVIVHIPLCYTHGFSDPEYQLCSTITRYQAEISQSNLFNKTVDILVRASQMPKEEMENNLFYLLVFLCYNRIGHDNAVKHLETPIENIGKIFEQHEQITQLRNISEMIKGNNSIGFNELLDEVESTKKLFGLDEFENMNTDSNEIQGLIGDEGGLIYSDKAKIIGYVLLVVVIVVFGVIIHSLLLKKDNKKKKDKKEKKKNK